MLCAVLKFVKLNYVTIQMLVSETFVFATSCHDRYAILYFYIYDCCVCSALFYCADSLKLIQNRANRTFVNNPQSSSFFIGLPVCLPFIEVIGSCGHPSLAALEIVRDAILRR